MKKLLLISGLALGLAASANAAIIAQDNGSNYGGGWNTGTNGGSGFGNWDFASNQGTGSAGTFIGNPADASITGMSVTSFGLYANPVGSNATIDVNRSFSSALSVGDTFSVQWGLNFDSGSGGGNKGLNIYAGGTSGTQLININMGTSQAITINGNPMFANYGTAAMTLSFQLTTGTNLHVSGIGRDGSESYSGNFTVAAAPDAFRFYANNLDTGDNRQPYFNNLQIASVPEPSAFALIGLGLAGLCIRRLKSRKDA